MRKRFEDQLRLGCIPIHQAEIPEKSRDAYAHLAAALKEIFVNPVYNQKVFSILEETIQKGKKSTGRNGMDLWHIFVMAQVRMCLNIGYDRLHLMANYDTLLRQLMGVENQSGFEKITFHYQTILDNVSLLDDETVGKLNEVIVNFGHHVFKKKEGAALHLKTDSFVVESNVHFPTDYNLLWDCARKSLDIIGYFMGQYNLQGWRKLKDWRKSIKGLMRSVGRASIGGGKNKEERLRSAGEKFLDKSRSLLKKLHQTKQVLPLGNPADLAQIIALERFIELFEKHIDLVDRRILQGEEIPHEEKMFSIFETYTEWITKGKAHPNVELGKKLAITTDQYNLIINYRVMENESDNQIVGELSGKLLQQHPVSSWSYDKGFYSKENKEALKQHVDKVVMPKKGKRNQKETTEEEQPAFIRGKNKHSAVESNINELEHCGLDRCPDRGYDHFKRYIGLGVCAYNLKKIGKELIKQRQEGQSPPLKKCA